MQISFHPTYKMQQTGAAYRKIKCLHVSVTSCCMTYLDKRQQLGLKVIKTSNYNQFFFTY